MDCQLHHLKVARLSYLAIGLVVASEGDGQQRTPSSATDWYRLGEFGGCNLLYLYAIAHRVSVDYKHVRDLMSSGNHLATLRDMEVGAAALGLSARVRKLTANDLGSLNYPVIAHIDGWNEAPGTGGEFVLLAGSEDRAFLIIEGITCAPTTIDKDEFLKRWAGYGLVQDCGVDWQFTICGFTSLLLLLATIRTLASRQK